MTPATSSLLNQIADDFEKQAAEDREAEDEYRERKRREPHRAHYHALNMEMHGGCAHAFREAAKRLREEAEKCGVGS